MEFDNRVILGDCLEVLRQLPDNIFDSVVTDPPYGLGTKEPTVEEIIAYLQGAELDSGGDFMGAKWEIPPVVVWKEVYRVLKPGGHVLSFGGTRTFDLISLGLRAAGFENRDTIADDHPALQWKHGQGFPKSLNVSAAIDKRSGMDLNIEKEIAAYIKESREALGLTAAEVDRQVFGGTTRQAFVEGRDNEFGQFRIYLPTPEEWVKLKAVLELDGRYDEAIETIPSREMRSKVDGGKGELVNEGEGSFGYQTDGERWDGSQRTVEPATDEAKKWGGYGTALKPAWEPILVFRKPLEGTVADNVLKHGTGALNIDATRVVGEPWTWGTQTDIRGGGFGSNRPSDGHIFAKDVESNPKGRWPPNVVMTHAEGCKRVGDKKIWNPKDTHSTRGSDTGNEMFGQGKGLGRPVSGQSVGYVDEDGLETVEAWDCVEGCPVKALDEQSGDCSGGHFPAERTPNAIYGGGHGTSLEQAGGERYTGDSGGASRFFPQFEGQELVEVPFFYTGKATKKGATLDGEIENKHPTKKPLKLMAWLVKLVTPKGGIVLDPYCGSGSTLHAAVEEGMRFTGVDSWDYAYEVATKRMKIVCQRAESRQGEEDLFALAMGGYEDA